MVTSNEPAAPGDHEWQPSPGAPVLVGSAACARLAQLGFRRPRAVREALQDGMSAARAAMTPNHPPSYPGTRMWGETTASLAYLGEDAGWEHENFLGVDVVTNHIKGVAVIVTAGDSATGFEAFVPQVRYERKEVITRLVNGELDNLWDASRGRAEWELWFLLHCLERGEIVVPAELSRPVKIGTNGLVSGWAERIIVPEFLGQHGSGLGAEIEDTPAAPIVNVQRRAG